MTLCVLRVSLPACPGSAPTQPMIRATMASTWYSPWQTMTPAMTRPYWLWSPPTSLKTNTRANLRQRLRMLLDRDEDVVIALLRAAVREQYLLTRELGAVVVALRQRVLTGSGNVPTVENVTFSDLVGKIKDRLDSDLAD